MIRNYFGSKTTERTRVGPLFRIIVIYFFFILTRE